MNRSALSVIIVVGILAISILGVVSFKTMPVLGDGPELSFVSDTVTSGTVNTLMTFKIQLLNCITTQDGKRCSGINGAVVTMNFDEVPLNLHIPASFTTDTNGEAHINISFPQAGTWQVTAITAVLSPVSIEVKINPNGITKSEIYGPTTGTAGDTLNYTVKAMECDATGNCHAPQPTELFIGKFPYEQDFEGAIDAQGVAIIAVPFPTAGTFTLKAAQVGGEGQFVSEDKTVTITPKSDNGGGSTPNNPPTGSIPTPPPTAKMNETALALESASGAASSPMGALWWILGIGAIILVAVIAAFLFLRRREDDEEDEGDVDDEYHGYEVRRR